MRIEGVCIGRKALFRDQRTYKVPSRQYPVTIHFARRSAEDYVDEPYAKVAKSHQRLPQGSILVFLCGREQVERL